MALFDSLARQANRVANDVQLSLRRARLEGERRLLQRSHRAALEALGQRVYDLVSAGKIPEGELAPELADVEARLMEIQAKVAEIDAIREAEEPGGADGGERPSLQAENGHASPGEGWEAARRFFKS